VQPESASREAATTARLAAVRLRNPGPGAVDNAINALAQVAGQLYGCRSCTFHEMQGSWLRWWEIADAQLRNIFAEDDLVVAPYRTRAEIAGLPGGRGGQELMAREAQVWIEKLEEVIRGLRALKPFIERIGRVIVPDTSAFIEGPDFTTFGWQELACVPATHAVTLVVPILVIEELDELKRHRSSRVQQKARGTLRELWRLHGSAPLDAASLAGQATTIEVFTDDPWHARRPVPDDEIVDRAAAIRDIIGREVRLAAADNAMLYRAAASGVPALLVPRISDSQHHQAGDRPASGQ
jgi:hypothetical protein